MDKRNLRSQFRIFKDSVGAYGEPKEIPSDMFIVTGVSVERPILIEGQFTIESRGQEFDEKVKQEFQRFIDRVNKLAEKHK